MKTCTGCGETKPLAEFNKAKKHPDGLNPRCRSCTQAYARSYYNRDLDGSRSKKRAYVKSQGEAGRAKAATRMRERRRNNPTVREYDREYNRRFNEANPDYRREWYWRNVEKARSRAREDMRKARASNPEGERARKRRYRQAHLAEIRIRESNNTHRRRSQMGPHNPTTAEYMSILSGDPCSYCGTRESPSTDHIVAVSNGGLHEPDNLTAACISCNTSKQDRPLLVWLATRP